MNYPNDIFPKFAEPGNFYSPIPGFNEVKKDKSRIFNHNLDALAGITIDDLRLKRFIAESKELTANMLFQSAKTNPYRY